MSQTGLKYWHECRNRKSGGVEKLAQERLELGQALEKATRYFSDKGCESPRLSAELLLAHALKADRLHLYMYFRKPLNEQEVSDYRELVRRRGNGEPVAYILGQKEFFSLEFEVGEGVLVPRPETEILVQYTLDTLNEMGDRAVRVWDLGTGSGAIAVMLASMKENCEILATDISEEALGFCRRNIERHQVEERISLFQADFDCCLDDSVKSKFQETLLKPFDIIVSNPPYIPSEEVDTLQWEVRDWEPRLALDGGPDGLDFYRRIIGSLDKYLAPEGWFLFELGEEQAAELVNEFGSKWTGEIRQDYSRKDRTIRLQRR